MTRSDKKKWSEFSRSQVEASMIGQRYARLTMAYPIVRTRRHLGGWWLAICRCGKECEVRLSEIRLGRQKSCGCAKSNKRDITGQRFGKLIAIRNIGRSKWLCKCDCGNIWKGLGSQLIRGLTRSCGCFRKAQSRITANYLKRRRGCFTGELNV